MKSEGVEIDETIIETSIIKPFSEDVEIPEKHVQMMMAESSYRYTLSPVIEWMGNSGYGIERG